jgi:hypothetical protein
VIRYAVRDDFTPLWPLLMDMHREQGLFSLNKEKAARTLGEAIDEGRVLVAISGGVVTGTFAWVITTLYYSNDRFLADLWLYVKPEHRRSMTAVRLRNAMKADARQRGLPLMAGTLGKKLNGSKLFGKDFGKVGEFFLMRS